MSPAPGRNDPCPCGSGRKYKKCCGAGAAGAPAASATRRECGTCTACCDGWLKIRIDGEEVYPGKPCPHSTGHSCRIYETRPEDPCRRFVCGWLRPGSPFPEEWRPDRLGVIILASTWRGHLVYGLWPAGRDPDDALIDWMKRYSAATRTPFMYQRQGMLYCHGPAEFGQEMSAKVARGERPW